MCDYGESQTHIAKQTQTHTHTHKQAANPDQQEAEVRHVDVAPSSMFFSYNSQLGPPYHVILDTNFINFSIQVYVYAHAQYMQGKIIVAKISQIQSGRQRVGFIISSSLTHFLRNKLLVKLLAPLQIVLECVNVRRVLQVRVIRL